ncbi:MAG: tyrosine-type recombinase/integrase [Candidatus Methanomethylicaceae archaeon]
MLKGLEYLNSFSSKSTKTMYRSAVKHFLSFVYGIKLEGEDLERTAKSYFEEGRNYQEDLERFFQSLSNGAPKTKRFKISAVKTYLLENEVELPEVFWRRLRLRVKGSRPLTLDRPPSVEELRKILNLMPIQGRALYLVLASSGMRIGEALQVTLNDLDLSSDPAKVYIRGKYTKTGNPRIAFVSPEAKEALDQWLKMRPQYMKQAVGRSWKYGKSEEDLRVFPFEITTAYAFWDNALRKSGLEEKDGSTGRKVLHPHALRKFFRTRMGSTIPVDIVEALMGHEGYLTECYRKYSQEDLAQFYKKGEHSVTIFGNGKDMAKVKEEMEGIKKEFADRLAYLTGRNMELERRLEHLRKSLEKRISKIEQMVDQAIELRKRQVVEQGN